MARRLFWTVRLIALLGMAGTLGGCVVYPAGGIGYRSPGYAYGAPAYRPYYGGGGGYYGRPGWGGGGHRGYYGRSYW